MLKGFDDALRLYEVRRRELRAGCVPEGGKPETPPRSRQLSEDIDGVNGLP